jgi:hypothetical protein
MTKYNQIQLMPHQWEEFNGDNFISKNFIRLRDEFKINHAIELGTCLGSTAIWLSHNFQQVTTIEINEEFLNIAISRFMEEGLINIKSNLGNTTDVLPTIKITNDCIVFIDSHWYDVCPMLDELTIIAEQKVTPVIAIHDFLVPNEPNLGYDTIHGQAFSIEWIKPYLEAIYGVNGFEYFYNSDAESTEIKRGIIYITPKKQKNELDK